MPYKCVHCSKIYSDDEKEVIQGCECRSKFFFYIKPEKLKEIENNQTKNVELSKEEKQQIEEDVREITGISDENSPVFLDFESITIIKSGKYVLDLQKLFATDKPRIYKLEDGKYIVDLSSSIRKN
jgi:predicted  nucleic acid-binding Zn-ribbon protein